MPGERDEQHGDMSDITSAVTTLVTHPANDWLGVLVDATLAGGLLVRASWVAHGTWVDHSVVRQGPWIRPIQGAT